MKKSSINPKTKDVLAQPKHVLPADKFQSIIHALAVKQDSSMTRVYTAIQTQEPDHYAALGL